MDHNFHHRMTTKPPNRESSPMFPEFSIKHPYETAKRSNTIIESNNNGSHHCNEYNNTNSALLAALISPNGIKGSLPIYSKEPDFSSQKVNAKTSKIATFDRVINFVSPVKRKKHVNNAKHRENFNNSEKMFGTKNHSNFKVIKNSVMFNKNRKRCLSPAQFKFSDELSEESPIPFNFGPHDNFIKNENLKINDEDKTPVTGDSYGFTNTSSGNTNVSPSSIVTPNTSDESFIISPPESGDSTKVLIKKIIVDLVETKARKQIIVVFIITFFVPLMSFVTPFVFWKFRFMQKVKNPYTCLVSESVIFCLLFLVSVLIHIFTLSSSV